MKAMSSGFVVTKVSGSVTFFGSSPRVASICTGVRAVTTFFAQRPSAAFCGWVPIVAWRLKTAVRRPYDDADNEPTLHEIKFPLLHCVPGKNDDLLGIVPLKRHLQEGLSKGSRSAGDQYRRIFKHVSLLNRAVF